MSEYIIKLEVGERLEYFKPRNVYFVTMIMPSIGRFKIKNTVFLNTDHNEAGVYESLVEAQEALERVKQAAPKMHFEHRFIICALDEIRSGEKPNEADK